MLTDFEIVIWGGKEYLPTDLISEDKITLYKPQEKSKIITCSMKRKGKSIFFKTPNNKILSNITFPFLGNEPTRDIVFTVVDALDKNNKIKSYNCPSEKYFPDGVNVEIILMAY